MTASFWVKNTSGHTFDVLGPVRRVNVWIKTGEPLLAWIGLFILCYKKEQMEPIFCTLSVQVTHSEGILQSQPSIRWAYIVRW